MLMSISTSLLLYLFFFFLICDRVSSSNVARADKPKKEPDPDCTATNPATGEFFDLRPLIRRGSDKSGFHEAITDIYTELIGKLTVMTTDIISLLIYASLY